MIEEGGGKVQHPFCQFGLFVGFEFLTEMGFGGHRLIDSVSLGNSPAGSG